MFHAFEYVLCLFLNVILDIKIYSEKYISADIHRLRQKIETKMSIENINIFNVACQHCVIENNVMMRHASV